MPGTHLLRFRVQSPHRHMLQFALGRRQLASEFDEGMVVDLATGVLEEGLELLGLVEGVREGGLLGVAEGLEEVG